jgi:diguanylate cyclase (GGDEF)-like protein
VQGEVWGLLRLVRSLDSAGQADQDKGIGVHLRDIAAAITDQLSSILTNLNLQEILRSMAMKDALTGLYNRRFLEESLDRELSRARRDEGMLGVLMLDLDHFKDFNDAYGHEVGDTILKTLATYLVSQIRSTDIVCRYGGEEFTVLLPGASLEDARERAESIRSGIHDLPGTEQLLAASLGVALYPLHGGSPADLLRAADAALYRAKAGGRDRVEVFSGF